MVPEPCPQVTLRAKSGVSLEYHRMLPQYTYNDTHTYNKEEKLWITATEHEVEHYEHYAKLCSPYHMLHISFTMASVSSVNGHSSSLISVLSGITLLPLQGCRCPGKIRKLTSRLPSKSFLSSLEHVMWVHFCEIQILSYLDINFELLYSYHRIKNSKGQEQGYIQFSFPL